MNERMNLALPVLLADSVDVPVSVRVDEAVADVVDGIVVIEEGIFSAHTVHSHYYTRNFPLCKRVPVMTQIAP